MAGHKKVGESPAKFVCCEKLQNHVANNLNLLCTRPFRYSSNEVKLSDICIHLTHMIVRKKLFFQINDFP